MDKLCWRNPRWCRHSMWLAAARVGNIWETCSREVRPQFHLGGGGPELWPESASEALSWKNIGAAGII